MPFRLNLLEPRNSRPPPRIAIPPEDYDSASSTDSTETAKSCFRSSHEGRDHSSYVASASTSLAPTSSYRSSSDFLLHPTNEPGRFSGASSAAGTPVPSRSGTPLPQFYSSAASSSCTSDADSEPTSPLLPRNRRNRWWNDDGQRWWITSREGRRRRRRKESWCSGRFIRRVIRVVLRHPLFPTQPTSILLTLLVLTIFAILLTLLLIHVLNPDKEPLPWRAYCSIPSVSTSPPSLSATSYSPGYPFNSLAPSDVSSLSSIVPNSFPPPQLDDYPPAGVFLGVFTMDSAVERRMLVRSTWASHERSRNGAGAGDDGLGTSRTVVRFVLGKPRSSWDRRIQLEAETYNDMIVLPIAENMNSGKTHSFFDWASTEAWVPPLPADHDPKLAANYSYTNITASSPIPLARHDPYPARQEWHMSGQQTPWVRPDFIVKVDDDSFVMLAELEARLRVELHTKTRYTPENGTLYSRDPSSETPHTGMPEPDVHKPSSSSVGINATAAPLYERAPPSQVPASRPSPVDDPLVYWGYLVKNQFMAGELYALSWSLVDWVARDPTVKSMTRGKEDKQVARWMRLHPRAPEVRWKSERCWIYDHPRAGTVYSHGFLFPSEVTRARKSILSYLSAATEFFGGLASAPFAAAPIGDGSSPTSWAYSSVTAFGVRYNPPLSDLTTLQAVEALVEGSDTSKLKEGGDVTAEDAWIRREGRKTRYEDKRVGGTIVVHFIKKNPWFLETALAFLEGEEQTVREKKQHFIDRALGLPGNSSDVLSGTSSSVPQSR
ncbi:hypothetical protein DFH11DRAFT_1500542 [Phellopilus nigrolimitatus]|nr:hypothetical protein DFH11DRAFT_1500542 [Phellopilus nigrolimitatus]